tara:strand:+ start:5764 stop:7068 length:1305 start_codon:yes stop_codon:yes gene_type:complete
MAIINDNNCGWLTNLTKRKNYKILNRNLLCDYLIVGAGYTGLSAARQLANDFKSSKIILVDSQLAGEGSSARNSGYLVDTTLNDGFTSNKDIENYKKKIKIYEEGINSVEKFIKEYQVDCDWNLCGKYFASSKLSDEKIAIKFSNLLSSLDFKNKVLYKDELNNELGTSFYNLGVYTSGGILLHPGKLIKAMVDTLPENVELFENTHLEKWKISDDKIKCNFKNYTILTKKIIFCTNGFLRSLNVRKNYSFPLTLTASLTRQLTKNEYENIGSPKEWGVLPIRPMGATIRMTKDKRILIRNTAEVSNPNNFPSSYLEARKKLHQKGINKRFPELPNDIIESTWSGVVCRSRNGSQIFERINDNVFVAGCYNGSGIGTGTFFGEQIALMASNQDSDKIKVIENGVKPSRLPPDILLNIGVYTRLIYERLRARTEI